MNLEFILTPFSDRASAVVRCSPDEDATNGFFVSCFARGVVDEGALSSNLKRKADADPDDPAQKAKMKKRQKKRKKSSKPAEQAVRVES
jgi:25S rRNA (cytosine2278-C5)-methyltransferase